MIRLVLRDIFHAQSAGDFGWSGCTVMGGKELQSFLLFCAGFVRTTCLKMIAAYGYGRKSAQSGSYTAILWYDALKILEGPASMGMEEALFFFCLFLSCQRPHTGLQNGPISRLKNSTLACPEASMEQTRVQWRGRSAPRETDHFIKWPPIFCTIWALRFTAWGLKCSS